MDDNLGNLFDVVADSEVMPGTVALSKSGMLPAGSYQFLALVVTDDAGAASFYDASAQFSFNLALQPVPEPNSLSLVAFGAMAWAATGRRGSVAGRMTK